MPKPANPELARRILDIALDELSRKPPDDVNMRSIASQAGVSPTAIYYYYASKGDLFEKIKFDAMDELEARLSAATGAASSSRDKLSALMREYSAWCLERPHLAGLLMEELPPQELLTDETTKKYYASFFRAGDLLSGAIAEGTVTPRDVLLEVSMAQAAIWGIVSQFRNKRVHPNFWDSIDPLIDRFITLLLGRQGTSV